VYLKNWYPAMIRTITPILKNISRSPGAGIPGTCTTEAAFYIDLEESVQQNSILRLMEMKSITAGT